MDWREKFTAVTEIIFPGLQQHKNELLRNEVTSSLPLQMALYFNKVFYPVWTLIICVFLYKKFDCFEETNKIILLIVIVPAVTIEYIRLYMGYQGNLKDKIPELTGFWMLSTLLQLPLQCIMLFYPFFKWRVVEMVAQVLMSTMLVLQIITGYAALKNTANYQASMFRIATFIKNH